MIEKLNITDNYNLIKYKACITLRSENDVIAVAYDEISDIDERLIFVDIINNYGSCVGEYPRYPIYIWFDDDNTNKGE